ncbi:MAG: type II toxin-antitoxin system HicA family toxin [Spirochaetia bacterium]
MNKKNQNTLAAIFKEPVRSDILWKDIENLLYALGTEVSEGKGSRVRIALKGVRGVFQRPHPRKETGKGSVKSLRRFLIAAGVSDVEV